MTTTNPITAYDVVAYDSEANADTHPIAMATLATFAGLEGVARARTARVLEIGCGDGTNLIRMARYLPEARFVGFDLAKTAIEAGRKQAPANVDLSVADIMELNVEQLGTFDYVIAHGMVSWVPEVVRRRLFALMREALAPRGVGFVSANALPGWELRRALREVALAATRGVSDPAKKVKQGLEAIAKLTQKHSWRASSFGGGLSRAATEYLDHVKRATPDGAPFERYVFHDLLADVNVPFSREELSAQLEGAGLHVLVEAPLGSSKPESVFLQLLVSKTKPTKDRTVAELYLWADFTKTGRPGELKTTTGALLSPVGEEGLARALPYAPLGFVKVRDLTNDVDAFSAQLEAGWREGVFTLVSEPPTVPNELVAIEPVLTNPLHRSYKITPKELELLRAGQPRERLEELRERLRRHLFLK